MNLVEQYKRIGGKLNEGKSLQDLKSEYYDISDALDGGHGIYNSIKNIGTTMEGEEWLAKYKIDPIKEAKIFEQIYKLFKQSKLGRAL